jgi:hypothetical protein
LLATFELVEDDGLALAVVLLLLDGLALDEGEVAAPVALLSLAVLFRLVVLLFCVLLL